MDGLDQLFTLISKGGNVAMVALAFLAWRIWLQFKELLVRLVLGQEQIKRAIIVSNPQTARIFDEKPLESLDSLKS